MRSESDVFGESMWLPKFSDIRARGGATLIVLAYASLVYSVAAILRGGHHTSAWACHQHGLFPMKCDLTNPASTTTKNVRLTVSSLAGARSPR